MKKAVIFDFYETLVREHDMNFNRALELLHERYLSAYCTSGELKAYGTVTRQKYLDLHAEGKEYALMREEIPDLLHHFGADITIDDPDFEYEFMRLESNTRLLPGVRELLEDLTEKDVNVYILSNSIFTAGTIRKYLAGQDVLQYFSGVISSAGPGVIKPDSRLFDEAVRMVEKDIPGIERSDIVFVGDTYETDAAGACAAGLRAVWLNRTGAENTRCLPVRVISDIAEVMSIVFPGTICCIGDSLTEGDWGIIPGLFKPNVHDINYPWYLSRMTGAEVKNFGRCGWKASDVLNWYKGGGFSVKGAEKVIILLGTNGGHDPEADTPDNRAYIGLIRGVREEAPQAEIYLCTPPNATEVPGKFFYGYAPHVRQSVAFVRKTAKEQGLHLIDLAASPRITPETEDELQPNDGLHFAEKGYRVLAEEVLRRL